jgi:hypothetical protein
MVEGRGVMKVGKVIANGSGIAIPKSQTSLLAFLASQPIFCSSAINVRLRPSK